MAAATETRAQKIRRYIELDALSLVAMGGMPSFPDEFLELVDAQEARHALGVGIAEELWPSEEDEDTVEFRHAMAEKYVLVARLFAWLGDHGHESAEWYLGLAAAHLRGLSPGAPTDA